MAYTINKYDGSFVVADETLNTETSLQLVGKDYFGYGQAIAQNSVSLLENFASDSEPTNPTEGQLWWHPTPNLLKVRHNGSWLSLDPNQGASELTDTLGQVHPVYIVRTGGVPITIVSVDPDFIIHPSQHSNLEPYFRDSGDITVAGPATIKPGVNLNTDSTKGMKFHGTATTALYADLAEMYSSDKEYEPGTLVMLAHEFDHDVTQTVHEKDPQTFGVVSTNPAYLMNTGLEGIAVPVALSGRVPCKVVGVVNKGDRLVSSNVPGHAQSADVAELDITWKHCFGRALENKTDEEPGIIEVVVGVK